MGKRVAFNVRSAIAAAWTFCWEDNLKRRAEYAKQGNSSFADSTFYLTASDIEEQVRSFAQEAIDGVPQGSTGRAWGGSWHSGLRISGNLQAEVRDYLMGHIGIARHNFGRGHCSGARFRPKGEPFSPAELRTFEAKRKEEQRYQQRKAAGEPTYRIHLRDASQPYYARPLCIIERERKRKEKAEAAGRRYYGSFGRSRHHLVATTKLEEANCPSCLKLAASKQKAAA